MMNGRIVTDVTANRFFQLSHLVGDQISMIQTETIFIAKSISICRCLSAARLTGEQITKMTVIMSLNRSAQSTNQD